jgi:DNA-binding IclR family transcriptional regulator
MPQNHDEERPAEQPDDRQVKSAARTLEVLDLLSGPETSWTIGGMARELRIPKSSLHGILSTMRARGWIALDDATGRIRLGIRALATGYAFVENDEWASLAQPVLDTLWDQTNEAVEYGRLDAADVVYLAKRDSHAPMRLYSAVGRRLPAHATALGKAILAGLPEEDLESRLAAPLAALTPNTIVDGVALREELQRVRESGFAIDRGENATGVVSIAAALVPGRSTRDALSVAVPAARATPERIDEVARAVTRSVQLLDLAGRSRRG